jgi:hypothetical protein
MKLFVRVVGPRDGSRDVGGPLESWIEAEAMIKGTEHPRAMSGWIEIGDALQTINASELGGREVFAQRIDDGANDAVTLRISGRKIDPVRQDIALARRPGTRVVVALTGYAGSRNILVAAEFR